MAYPGTWGIKAFVMKDAQEHHVFIAAASLNKSWKPYNEKDISAVVQTHTGKEPMRVRALDRFKHDIELEGLFILTLPDRESIGRLIKALDFTPIAKFDVKDKASIEKAVLKQGYKKDVPELTQKPTSDYRGSKGHYFHIQYIPIGWMPALRTRRQDNVTVVWPPTFEVQYVKHDPSIKVTLLHQTSVPKTEEEAAEHLAKYRTGEDRAARIAEAQAKAAGKGKGKSKDQDTTSTKEKTSAERTLASRMRPRSEQSPARGEKSAQSKDTQEKKTETQPTGSDRKKLKVQHKGDGK